MNKKIYVSFTVVFLIVLSIGLLSSFAAIPDGDVAPLGNPDGIVNVGDALVALRFALGLETPTQEDTIHGDVAPLDTNGQPQPDGSITVGDALVILRKALGLVDWTISKDTHTITIEGGSIELSNGATLTIPPNNTEIPIEVLFAETSTPPHIGGEVIKAYTFVTDSELLTSEFTLPVEATDVTSADELMIVYMQGHNGPADPVAFTYDPSGNTVSFSLPNNWTFQNIPGPAKTNLIHLNRNSTAPQENNKDNAILIIRNTPYPSVTGKSGPIQMPFFEQGNSGTCWANVSKILQKGLFTAYLGAGFTYEVFQFMRMLNLGLNEGILWNKIDDLANVIGRGKTIQYERYFYWESWSSVQKKILEEINRGNPVAFFRSKHMVLVLGYEKDANGDLYLIQHNPQNIGSIGGLYQKEKWEDAIKNHPTKDVAALLWAEEIPDPNRALQSINLPCMDVGGTLFFRGGKTDSDPLRLLHLKFDNTFTDGYRWQRADTTTVGNSNHFTKNVNQLFFEMPVYNADLNNNATVTFGIKVYEKDNSSNEVVFSKDIVIAPKNKSTVKGDLDLTPVRVNLEEESECVLYITLEKGTERTTSIPLDNFFLQPLELEITVSIPGASPNTAGNYEIVADGATSTIKAEVKDKDGNNVADGTKVEFATTGGSLSTTTATTTNGETTVTLTSPTTIGSAEITASISKISGSAKIDFISGPISSLILSANPDTLPADGSSTSTIEIKAVDANGNPVADSSIGITSVSGTLSAASATTDKDGVATVVYTVPLDVPEGAKDMVTATSDNGVTDELDISLHPQIIIDVWPQMGAEGLQVEATCYISDPGWTTNEPYRFYFGGYLVSSITSSAYYTFTAEGTYDVYCLITFANGIQAISNVVSVWIMEEEPSIGNYFGCHIPEGAIKIESPGIFGPTLRFSLDGKTVGPYVTWIDDQKTQLSEFYCYGENETYDGYYGKWFSNGVQAEQGYYVENKRHGSWINRRMENGTKQTVYYYYMGELNAIHYYDSDGYYLWTNYGP